MILPTSKDSTPDQELPALRSTRHSNWMQTSGMRRCHQFRRSPTLFTMPIVLLSTGATRSPRVSSCRCILSSTPTSSRSCTGRETSGSGTVTCLLMRPSLTLLRCCLAPRNKPYAGRPSNLRTDSKTIYEVHNTF